MTGWGRWSTGNCARNLNLTIWTSGICITQNLSKKMRCTNLLGFWDTNGSSNLGQLTRPSDSQQKKRTCWIVDFDILADHRIKWKESEKGDEYLELARKLKKYIGHEGDSDTNFNWCTWNNPQRIGKGTERFGNKRTTEDHLDYSIFKISQNTGDLRRLPVTQTPGRNHQLMLVWKTLKRVKWFLCGNIISSILIKYK